MIVYRYNTIENTKGFQGVRRANRLAKLTYLDTVKPVSPYPVRSPFGSLAGVLGLSLGLVLWSVAIGVGSVLGLGIGYRGNALGIGIQG